MASWKEYLKVLERKGKAAAWAYAQSNFAPDSLDYAEAQRYHAPTAKQRTQSAANRKAMARELNPAFVAQNCQMNFGKK